MVHGGYPMDWCRGRVHGIADPSLQSTESDLRFRILPSQSRNLCSWTSASAFMDFVDSLVDSLDSTLYEV